MELNAKRVSESVFCDRTAVVVRFLSDLELFGSSV